MAEQSPSAQTTIGVPFKLIFLTVVALTILSAIGAVVLAFGAPAANPYLDATHAALVHAFQLGLGCIIGLLGGKTAV